MSHISEPTSVWKRFGVLLLLIAVMSPTTATARHSPAAADPSANRIVALRLLLAEYPNRDTQLACDGNDVVTFRNLRVEARIDVESTSSEHWATRIKFTHTDRNGKPLRESGLNWSQLRHHQNVGPDRPPRNYEFDQISQTLSPGLVIVSYKVIGAESGIELEASCSFMVV